MTRRKASPFKLMTDTSVWLDLAKDYRAQPVIAVLDDLISANAVELLTPQTVLGYVREDKARVIEESRRSLQSHFRLIREAEVALLTKILRPKLSRH